MMQTDLENIYDSLAHQVDVTGAASNLFLAKLCLLMAREIGDGARVEALIETASKDLAPPR